MVGSPGRRVRRALASVAHTVAPSAGVLVSLLVVRVAGLAVWGEFIAALALVRLLGQVVAFGNRDLLVRDFGRDPTQLVARWQRNLVSRAWLLLPAVVVLVAVGGPPERVAAQAVWLAALFVAQSHDAMIAWRRAFRLGLAVELSGTAAILGIVAATVALDGPLTADTLIAGFAVVAVARALLLSARFGMLTPALARARPRWEELREGWPFFALTFSGAVQSRVDLYVAAVILAPATLGVYAVLTNFVLLVQSLAPALLAPVAPTLYRLRRAAVLALATRLGLAGVPLSIGGVLGTWLALAALYGIDPGLPALAWAGLAMLPAMLYLPLVHLAFREGRERQVLAVNVLAIAVSGLGAAALAPRFGVAGAMAAAAAAQLTIAAAHLTLTARSARPAGAAA